MWMVACVSVTSSCIYENVLDSTDYERFLTQPKQTEFPSRNIFDLLTIGSLHEEEAASNFWDVTPCRTDRLNFRARRKIGAKTLLESKWYAELPKEYTSLYLRRWFVMFSVCSHLYFPDSFTNLDEIWCEICKV